MMKRFFVFLLMQISLFSVAFSQELIVKSLKVSEGDISAQIQPRLDTNDRNCALIKVGLTLDDVQFDGNLMGKVEHKIGEYWVYMPQGNSMLRILHKDYTPLMINFFDYGLGKLQSGVTYVLTLEKPTNAVVQQKQTILDSASSVSSGDGVISIPLTNDIKIEMVKIEAGTFVMGATIDLQDLVNDQKPVHRVTLTNDYYIGRYEVTQSLWEVVMGNNPSFFKEGENYPVNFVTWIDCQEFINKLNNMTGRQFRLPTEAEWEYAARGGKKSRGYQYSGSNNISDVAWYGDNSGRALHPVGAKQANELGIYDMSGNVEEWCQDWYGPYSKSSQVNPIGASNGEYRVRRGGSCDSFSGWCCSSSRHYGHPNGRNSSGTGFRLVLSE